MTHNLNLKPIQTKANFVVDKPVKWCAGCGSFSILSSVQNALPELGYNQEDIVFVSGIGCSSRFPYYIKTYGFHSLHGRALPIASGIKITNPKLSVWVVTGDGDSMAIGGNHFIHTIRRNIDLNVLVFNNKIYGLTKGQYSPTTPKGSITKTSPNGTIENPFMPAELVMGAQGSFFARVVDTEPKIMKEVFVEAARHNGTSIVEILENCVIFNDDIHAEITGKEFRKEHQIYLEHGKPMIFGENEDKGLVLDGLKLKVVKIGKNGIKKEDILVHDAHYEDPTLHFMLSRMTLPDFPVAMGVIRAIKTIIFEDALAEQIKEAKEKTGINSVYDLLNSGNVFEIK